MVIVLCKSNFAAAICYNAHPLSYWVDKANKQAPLTSSISLKREGFLSQLFRFLSPFRHTSHFKTFTGF